jgi:hypothetical protein
LVALFVWYFDFKTYLCKHNNILLHVTQFLSKQPNYEKDNPIYRALGRLMCFWKIKILQITPSVIFVYNVKKKNIINQVLTHVYTLLYVKLQSYTETRWVITSGCNHNINMPSCSRAGCTCMCWLVYLRNKVSF